MIQINEDWRIHKQADNFVLQNKVTVNITKNLKPTGKTKEEWKDIGYFMAIEGALKAWTSKQVGEATSLAEIAKITHESLNTIRENIIIPIEWYLTAFDIIDHRKQVGRLFRHHREALKKKLAKELEEATLNKPVKKPTKAKQKA